ncbi:SDR family oxidoreductase [Streptomyces sp. NRRL F-5135]|uniref:SDR family oxidoreductase n=1 Tax=Streptomyces sp. NRRL F-5135 TaxID=1463858 RepID=UPI0004C7B651|nr:SDR family oxidoreductase [Streptomyces sp. NRRL F-5135]
MSSHLPLRGRTAVVTGAARGIGAQLARTLSARGARLALVGSEEAALERVAASLPGEADHWHADVTDADAMARTARRVAERFGRVDAVVANAGVAAGGLFLDSDPGAWRRVIEVNLVGSAVTARAFLPALLVSRGYYLQIASLAALAPAPMMSAYCASKAGVEAFAHTLRTEVAHHGVRVGVAYLSWTDTDMARSAEQDSTLRELRARLPWPADRTYPVAPAVDRLASGIERRAHHIYAQPWLRAARLVRAALPTAGARHARRHLPALEPWASGTPTTLLGASAASGAGAGAGTGAGAG